MTMSSNPGLGLFFVVGVAQSVEHRIVAPDVAGSSPVTHPITFRACFSPSTPQYVAGIPGKVGP